MIDSPIVLDTNILISAIVYGGKPRVIFQLALAKDLLAVTSPFLLTELYEILSKKFAFLEAKIKLIDVKIRENFQLVYPSQTINILKDKADNRVLETAMAGECSYIITGDKELLGLKKFRKIKILTAGQFLSWFGKVTLDSYFL